MWGAWTQAIAKDFAPELITRGKEFEGAPWTVLSDWIRFLVPSEDVARTWQEAMRSARAVGCEGVAAVVGSIASARLFTRIALASGVRNGVFTNQRLARIWLEERRARQIFGPFDFPWECGEAPASQPDAPAATLTRREREVLDLALQDLSNKQIGDRLGIAHSTVRVLMMRIAAKINVRSRAELVSRGRRSPSKQAAPEAPS